jgi:predicted RND superfamily exporter protein
LFLPYSPSEKKINPKKTRRHGGQYIFNIVLVKIHSMMVSHPVKILTFFIIITVAAVIRASFVKVESNTAKLIKKGNLFRDITDYIEDKMGV